MQVVIEGLDGVGKSTISKLISQKYNFKYIEKPSSFLFETSNTKENNYSNFIEIESNVYNTNSEMITAWFFGLGNLIIGEKYKDENIIIDRHFASNYQWNGNDKTDIIFKTMLELVGVPEINIILYASPEERFKRIYNRNKEDIDLKSITYNNDEYKQLISFYKKFNIPYYIVNTNSKTINEVFNEVDSIINSYICKKANNKSI